MTSLYENDHNKSKELLPRQETLKVSANIDDLVIVRWKYVSAK